MKVSAHHTKKSSSAVTVFLDVIRSQCFNKGVTMSDNSFLSFKVPNAYKCVWNVFGKKHPSKDL